jgi:membrane fusion protein, multidrug efflux system
MRPVFGLAAVVLVLASCSKSAETDAATQDSSEVETASSSLALPVVGEEVRTGDLVLSVSARGTLKSEAQSILKSEAVGTVQQVLVRPGDRVARGQKLVVLDPEPFRIAVEKAEAALRTARVNYLAEIGPDSIASGQAPSEARRAYAIAKSGIETAEVNLREAKLQLDRSVITAPFDGVLERVSVAVGERISAGQEMAVVVDLMNLRMEARVNEQDLPLLRVGGQAEVSIAAQGGEPVRGTIAAVLPMVDSTTRAGTALIRLRGDGKLRPGMYADARLEASRLPNRTLVPARAVIEREGRPLVFVVRDDIAMWEYVQVGRSNGRETEVLPDSVSGLLPVKPGDVVLVDGHLTLTHQAKVRLVATRDDQ